MRLGADVLLLLLRLVPALHSEGATVPLANEGGGTQCAARKHFLLAWHLDLGLGLC